MSLADRPAAGLYVAAWLLGGLGFLALILGLSGLVEPGASAFLIIAAIAALLPGMVAAAGYQLVVRKARPAGAYHGPAPLILFVLQVVLVNAIGLVLLAFGIPFGASPAGFLVTAVLLLSGYLIVVWLFVVRAGALSWRDIIRTEPFSAGRAVVDIAIGALAMFGVAIVAGFVGTIIANLLGTSAPDVVPAPKTNIDILLALLAAALLVPIGEEVFFRGFAISAWMRDLGPRSALIRATVLFALIHVFNITASTFADGAKQAILEVAVIGPVGLALGWLYLRRGLLASIGGHAAFNLLGVLVIVLQQFVPPPGTGS